MSEINNKTTSLEVLESNYVADLRECASLEIEEELKSKAKSSSSFFENFRTFEEAKTRIEDKDPLYDKYKNYVIEETSAQASVLEKIENEIEFETFFLRWERRQFNVSDEHSLRSNSATRYHADRIKELKKQKQEVISTSPEAWQFSYCESWRNDIAAQHSQRLVPVPYVMDTKNKIIDSLNLGVPVYLVGHLGSGKTQMAIEAAIDFSIQNLVHKRIEEDLENWYRENTGASVEDAKSAFMNLSKKWHSYYDEIRENGTQEEIEFLQPLFISGSHNLTYEDMFVEKTLSLQQNFDSESFEDYLNVMVVDYLDWIHNHSQEIEPLIPEEQLQLKVQIWKSFSDILIAKNNSFGTTIQKIEREILIALKQGRPVIVDELNTIAMQNLIALNDLLQRHAGQTAYITGVGQVKIEEGFAFIGTGNLSTQMVQYEGTNQLNPAFQSRFVTIEYNYVPQSIMGDLKQDSYMSNNELFRVMLSTLANRSGTIQLPNGPETMNELYRFAQLSRLTQNVFMGKVEGLESSEQSGAIELREAVLSIRNIIHVLENWNCGEEKSLSKALWDGFISSITYANDQNYILSQAVHFGFFKESDGWCVSSKALGDATTTYDEIRSSEYEYHRGSLSTYATLDIVHLLYGKEPKRKRIPLKLRETMGDEADYIETLKASDIQNINQQLEHLEYTKFLLDYLLEEDE